MLRSRSICSLLTALAFLAPWIIGLGTLVLYPFFASLYWSFCRYDLLGPPRWVGLENYERLAQELWAGERLGLAAWNTLYYALVSVPLSVVLGIALAVMLTWNVPGRAALRALFFLPSVVPVVATSVLWLWLLDPQRGLVNLALRGVGLDAPGWFNSVREAFSPLAWWQGTADFGSKDALVLMSLWGSGNVMIIYLAALYDIPVQLYEAAELDGAGRWARFWRITLPLLTPVILFNVVMGLIHAVQAFTQVYLVSEGQGAPAGATLLLSLHLFLVAFKDLEMGYASAVAWTLLVVVMLATWALFRWSRRWVFYSTGVR